MKYELTKAGINVFAEVGLPVVYDGIELDVGYRIDLLIDDKLIVELKSVAQLRSVHRSQLLTYLKLANKEVGLLLNFNTPHLKQGIIRVVNSDPTSRPSRCFALQFFFALTSKLFYSKLKRTTYLSAVMQILGEAPWRSRRFQKLKIVVMVGALKRVKFPHGCPNMRAPHNYYYFLFFEIFLPLK